MSRGNEKKEIFHCEADRQRFLRLVAGMAERYELFLHAYALMPNHYHFLIEAPKGSLSLGMQWLNGIYGRYFNQRYERVGHLFQGRFKSVLVSNERYFVVVSRYIHRNPVKAGLVDKPWDYAWSSCRDVLGLRHPLKWLRTERTLAYFEGDATRAYRAFIDDNLENDSVVEAVARDISANNEAESLLPASSLLKIEAAVAGSDCSILVNRSFEKKLATYLLRIQGMKQFEIARLVGITGAAVSQRISGVESEMKRNLKLVEIITALARDLRAEA